MKSKRICPKTRFGEHLTHRQSIVLRVDPESPFLLDSVALELERRLERRLESSPGSLDVEALILEEGGHGFVSLVLLEPELRVVREVERELSEGSIVRRDGLLDGLSDLGRVRGGDD